MTRVHDNGKGPLVFFATAAAFVFCAQASAERFKADKIVFEDVTGAVEIVTNGGDEIDVVVAQGKTYSKVETVLGEDRVLTVRGEAWKDEERRDCCNDRIRRTVNLRKDRALSQGEAPDDDFFTDYPTIKVTMPRAADVSFIDARMKIAMGDLAGALNLDACYAYGEIGDVEEAVIGLVAGSRLVLGDVAAALELDVSGDADLLAGDAAMADIDIAGPGDVVVGSLDGMLDISIAGSGAVRASRLVGPLTVRIAGSGAVAVKSGRAEGLRATIDGSGGVFFEGAVVRPDLRLFGSAEVRMATVTGSIKRAGGGEVYVGDELIPKRGADD